jgi:hypothetical protein
MSTVVRKKRQSRRELGAYRRYELLCGEIVYPVQNYDGYGDGEGTNLADFISDEMRADWEANREELIAFWKSGEYTHDLPWLFVCGSRKTLPWAAKQFDK